MAVNIDTVYQKVLALCNKEQRGYITPQEFNLMADKAQKEIYDSYFHDLKMAYHKPTKTDMTHADEIDILKEKLHPFKVENPNITQESGDNTVTLPSDLYFIDTISTDAGVFQEVDREEILTMLGNPLTTPTSSRPVYSRYQNQLQIYPTPTAEIEISIHYWKEPTKPEWGYVVINKKALYNSNSTYSTNFELHASEEENIVSRILQLAGVIIMKPGIVEIGGADKVSIKQSQND
jgi:hypothetical protein